MHVDAVEVVGLAAASFLAQRGRVSVALVSAVESGLLPLSKHKVVSSRRETAVKLSRGNLRRQWELLFEAAERP